jgi:phosphatidylserine/phosphatidylglycerophosphate/cardiolipin synthase-like enzyme
MRRADSLLIPGDSCWRVERADQAAFLVDGADYFAAVKQAILSARQSIWMLAWVFDPLTRFMPDQIERSGDPANPDRLGLILRRLAALNPGLDVRILAWDMPPLIAAPQAFPGRRAADYFKDSPVKFRLDASLPLSACHHQKLLIVDGRLAFISGGDLGADRWDTCHHDDDDRRRRLPNGKHYPARHDVALMTEGPVAGACGELFIDRWRRSGGGDLDLPTPPEDSIWPQGFAADLFNVEVALARTTPRFKDDPGVQEGERLHLAAIGAARRLIFLENQYLTSPVIVEALAQRLKEADGPEIITIGPSASPSFFDRMTMDSARATAINRLTAADIHGRFRAFSARTAHGDQIIVHSKVSIFDDRLIRIGSANLNNRSGGLDTELDAAIEAADGAEGAETRRTIAAFRALLIGHYFGKDLTQTQEAIREAGSVAAAIDALDSHPRRLEPVAPRPLNPLETFVSGWSLGDPLAVSDAWRPWIRRSRIKQALECLPLPASRSRRSAADGPTPPGTAGRKATRPW